jgi:ABC-type lipoprotein export system ATPase subunit
MLAEFETQVKSAGQTEIVEHQHQVVSVESIANAEIDDKPIIRGLIDERESLIISAASGVGKSLLTNCIALVLGNPTAGKLWNLFPIPNKVKTLIVQSENGFNAK